MCTFEEQQAETLLYLNKVGEVMPEDWVCIAAERLDRLLTEHPGDGVEDVGLSATVGTNDTGHSPIEHKLRAIVE